MEKRKKFYRYSQNFKDAVLKEVRANKLSVVEISKLYRISNATVYKWMRNNEIPTPDREVVYVELKDHHGSLERISKLEAKIRDLEGALSDKVLENCKLQAMVNVAEKHYGVDLKKKLLVSKRQRMSRSSQNVESKG